MFDPEDTLTHEEIFSPVLRSDQFLSLLAMHGDSLPLPKFGNNIVETVLAMCACGQTDNPGVS
ncbi:MAG: hypothetical protein JWQ87_2631 [Candidatus Sulfotelmatobacter sp.]|nr:hypothetical protein [Candidatus Sulfotelmatobacter sp.]